MLATGRAYGPALDRWSRADRKVGGTVETPAQDRGGRESKSHPHNNLPPSVLLAGETAYPTLVSWHFVGRRPIVTGPKPRHNSGLCKLRKCSNYSSRGRCSGATRRRMDRACPGVLSIKRFSSRVRII